MGAYLYTIHHTDFCETCEAGGFTTYMGVRGQKFITSCDSFTVRVSWC